jgi:uncharacterized membrane protein YgcG
VANSDPEHGDQPERIEITVAELLAQRSGSGTAPTRRPTRHADTVFGRLSPRRRAAVTAGAVLAAGSVLATALFGPTHLFRPTAPVPTGSHDPDGGHPNTGPPALPHPAPPSDTHGLGDLPDALNPVPTPPSALPTRALLTAPDRARRAAAPGRAAQVRAAAGSHARSGSRDGTNNGGSDDGSDDGSGGSGSRSGGGSSGGGTSGRAIGSVGGGVVSVGPASVPLDEPVEELSELTNDNPIAPAGSALSSLTRL